MSKTKGAVAAQWRGHRRRSAAAVGLVIKDAGDEWALGSGTPSGVVMEIDEEPHAAIETTIWLLPDGSNQVGGEAPAGATEAVIVGDGDAWTLTDTGKSEAGAYLGEGDLLAIASTLPRVAMLPDTNIIYGV